MDQAITFIDLFAGLSGTRIGFENGAAKCGINAHCVFTSDIKKAAIKAHNENYADEKVFGNISKIPANEIPDCNYILAGFPCQPFSQAGARRGFSDTRGTLFFDVARIAKEKNVDGLLLENVENFARHDGGKTLSTVVVCLEELGYHVSYRVLDASEFGGVPQKRKRIYIVALKSKEFDFDRLKKVPSKTFGDIREYGLPLLDTDFTNKLIKNIGIDNCVGKQIIDKRSGTNSIHSWDFNAKGETTIQQRLLLEKIQQNQRRKIFAQELGIAWRDGMPLNIDQIRTFLDYPELQNDLDYLCECGYLLRQHPYCDGSLEQRMDLPIGYKLITGRIAFELNRILSDDDICVTLTATDARNIGCVDGKGVRRLSKRECLRMFGFPEEYKLDTLSEEEAYDVIGNSIVVPVIEQITKNIFE